MPLVFPDIPEDEIQYLPRLSLEIFSAVSYVNPSCFPKCRIVLNDGSIISIPAPLVMYTLPSIVRILRSALLPSPFAEVNKRLEWFNGSTISICAGYSFQRRWLRSSAKPPKFSDLLYSTMAPFLYNIFNPEV